MRIRCGEVTRIRCRGCRLVEQQACSARFRGSEGESLSLSWGGAGGANRPFGILGRQGWLAAARQGGTPDALCSFSGIDRISLDIPELTLAYQHTRSRCTSSRGVRFPPQSCYPPDTLTPLHHQPCPAPFIDPNPCPISGCRPAPFDACCSCLGCAKHAPNSWHPTCSPLFVRFRRTENQ